MPVTLAQAQLNAQADIDFAVIDNFRRYSWVLDQIVFDDSVSPGTGGDPTLVYGYTRLKAPRGADFRAFNSEYERKKALTEQVNIHLKPLGGRFGLDRALARIGNAATNAEAIQMQQVITATRVRFIEELFTGDVGDDPNGFDGLDIILTGTETERTATDGAANISPAAITSQAAAMAALDEIDLWLSSIVPSTVGGGDLGEPGALPPGVKAIFGNTRSVTRLKALARWAGIFAESKDDVGRTVQMYGDWVLQDAGHVADGSAPIIPTAGDGTTSLHAVTFGMDSVHGASPAGTELVATFPPVYDRAGAVQDGEVEMGPVALAVENTKSCGVLRGVDVVNEPV